MKVSLVICTYNRINTLPATLRSVELLRYPKLEVIVVDGPSTDGTFEYLEREWKDKIKLCKCDEANLSKSRNIGIKNACGDIICFTDDDGVPESDWLDALVIAYTNPKVGAAGGWVRDHTGVNYQTKYIISSRNSTSEVMIDDPSILPDAKPDADTFLAVIGVNSSFRKTALLDVGGFDEEYAYFLDETDVIIRMIDAGYSVEMIPHAEVHHKYAPSHIRSDKKIIQSWMEVIKSTTYFIIKNMTKNEQLPEKIKSIWEQQQGRRGETNYYLNAGLINQDKYDSLMSEIDQGYHNGLFDAFANTPRQLIGEFKETAWQAFPRKLLAEQRLHLAFVTALYPPRHCGGVAVFIYNLAIQLAQYGHEVTVITQAENGSGHTVDFEDGVWVHRLPNDDNVAFELPTDMPDMPEMPKKVAGRVLAELNRINCHRQFHYVIGSIWDLDLAAVIASKKYRTAMYLVTNYKIMEKSKSEWRANHEFYVGHVQKMINAEMWALKNVTHVLSSTKAILSDTEKAYDLNINRNKLTVLPFGVPDENLPPKTQNPTEVYLLYVGRFEHRKGIDLLLEILPDLMEKYPQLVVTCIGDKALQAINGKTYEELFLEKHADKSWLSRVSFPGHVDDQTLEQSYATCDIFVAPSRYESFGLIYLEAMRFGKPCIGTTAGGIPEVICDQKTGLLVPPDNAQALQNALITLIADKNLRQQLGQAGRCRYLENFTTEIFAKKFESLIYKLIK
ncbi:MULTISPECIES: glycosyltransferase [Snodgrassella]|uniref:glycosyltransferase n=1 Tax=Snodgrassella TaxID=1193515 RepID=UPI0008154EC0|nr:MULTISPECIES: glycosyltransferase [Snodgrassella]SCC01537.1 hypothetical protein GA0061082_10647 [Snodgrassella sp. R-53583]